MRISREIGPAATSARKGSKPGYSHDAPRIRIFQTRAPSRANTITRRSQRADYRFTSIKSGFDTDNLLYNGLWATQQRREFSMTIDNAQREMRSIYLGGAIGQTVSGVIWLISAALGTFISQSAGLVSLFLGGCLIFLLTQLVLKLLGRPASASKANPLNGLATEIAFIVPLCIPVIYAAARYNINWYYPAFLIVVGAHYLPFMFLYGIRHYAILAGLLIAGGVALAVWLPTMFAIGGWFGGITLIGFAMFLFKIATAEAKWAVIDPV
jgi:hypothetical protein